MTTPSMLGSCRADSQLKPPRRQCPPKAPPWPSQMSVDERQPSCLHGGDISINNLQRLAEASCALSQVGNACSNSTYFANKFGNYFFKQIELAVIQWRCGHELLHNLSLGRASPATILGRPMQEPTPVQSGSAEHRAGCAAALACDALRNNSGCHPWTSPVVSLDRPAARRAVNCELRRQEPRPACHHIAPHLSRRRVAAIYIRGGDFYVRGRLIKEDGHIGEDGYPTRWMLPWFASAVRWHAIDEIVVFGNRAAHSSNDTRAGAEQAALSLRYLHKTMEFARNQTGLPVWLAPEDIASHMGRNIIPTESVRLSTGSILRDVPVRLPTTGSILRDVRCMIESTMLVVIGGGTFKAALEALHEGCSIFRQYHEGKLIGLGPQRGTVPNGRYF